MKNLYIMGSAGSGKTAMAVGLALKFRQEGLRVNYFKPVGISTAAGKPDEDAVLMREILGMKADLETIVPTTASPFYLSRGNRKAELLDTIRQAYDAIASESDIVMMDSAIFPHIMGTIGLDAPTLAHEFKACALYLINVKNDFSLDQAVFFNNYIRCQGVTVLGDIFTHVPRPILSKIEGVYKPLLDDNGFRTLGIVPRVTELSSPSVAQVYEVLGGELLTGEKHLDLLVEDIMVGAMTIESALTFMRRSNNKVFITGGDRADMALAALETSTSAIILTGGLHPDVKVISRAMEKSVPVILVHYDTYTTIGKLSELSGRITVKNKDTIKKAIDNVERHCDWKTILNSLR